MPAFGYGPRHRVLLEVVYVMRIVVSGSIGYDYIMFFPGYFKDHILPDQIQNLSISFLVDSMKRHRGGCARHGVFASGPRDDP